MAVVTTVAPVHLEFFRDEVEIAEAKAEIFEGVRAGGSAVINRDNQHFDLLRDRAAACGISNVIGFGAHESAEARLIEKKVNAGSSFVRADICGEDVSYTIGASGDHWVMNSLGVLGAVHAIGADVHNAASALADIEVPKGRGAEERIVTEAGEIITLVDESYNANPASMGAALSTLGARSVVSGGRRIAVLGDMRELGKTSDELHRAMAVPIEASQIDRVFCCGPHMSSLWDALTEAKRGGYSERSEDLIEPLLDEIQNHDVIMVKGSLGTNMAPIVKAIQLKGT